MNFKNTCFQDKEGNPLFLIGINYWPRKTGPLMWSRWNPGEIRAELKQMKSLGINVCRFFLFFPEFMPSPDKINPQMVARLRQFLSICDDEGLYTLPTFFVGHMSGEDWDVPWRDGRNFYSDPWMVEREVAFVQEIAGQCKNEKSVVGWILSNEIPNYGGYGNDGEITPWAKTLIQAIREVDPGHPISIGDGCWSPEVYGEATRFYLRELKEVEDFFGPHFYPEEEDELRHAYYPSFVIKMCQSWGRPVLLEEFGTSNTMASEENQGGYFRSILSSGFLAGAVGALGWCYSDYNLTRQRPYTHHPHELRFGVTRSNGSVKPAGQELVRFRRIMDVLNDEDWTLWEDPVGLLIPSYYYYEYPYSNDNKPLMFRIFLHTYTLMKKAHLNGCCFPEPPLNDQDIESPPPAAIPEDIRLLVSPYTQKLTVPFWEEILRYVERGGVFYSSHAPDGWVHVFEELYGARHHLRPGLVDLPGEKIRLVFVKNFGQLKKGDELVYHFTPGKREGAFCPLEPTTAEVLAVDSEDRPAIISNKIGKGKVFFSAFPIEYYLSQIPDQSQDDNSHRFYDSLASLAGVKALFSLSNPLIELGTLHSFSNGDYILYLINQGWREERTEIHCRRQISFAKDIETDQVIPAQNSELELTLPPKGVKVLRITPTQ